MQCTQTIPQCVVKNYVNPVVANLEAWTIMHCTEAKGGRAPRPLEMNKVLFHLLIWEDVQSIMCVRVHVCI